jgi:hypothetical protein
MRAYRDLLAYCRRQAIPVVLVIPAESSCFRLYQPPVEEAQIKAIADLARELQVPLVDTRAWMTDDAFWDGHHMTGQAAIKYSERFGREIVQPHLGPLTTAKPIPDGIAHAIP